MTASSWHVRSDLELAIGAGRVVTREYHNQAVEFAVETEQRKAASREYRLRVLLDLANADRVAQLIADLGKVSAGSPSLKHTPDCWQRHAGCLAARLRSVLDGKVVAQ